MGIFNSCIRVYISSLLLLNFHPEKQCSSTIISILGNEEQKLKEKEDNNLISSKAYKELNHFFSTLSNEQLMILDSIQEEILANINRYNKMINFQKPVEDVEAIFLNKARFYSESDQLSLKCALLAKLALHLPILVDKMNLPKSILVLYPNAFGRLIDFLKNHVNYPYDSKNEFFRKDIRFVLGLSIPCGARIVDMNSRVPFRSVLFSGLRSKNINVVIRYIRAHGNGPWFRNHADSRYLNEYNEKAHDEYYLRVAELLKAYKNIKGLVGCSWYYDPQLLKISPHLAYLYERPRERGAFFLRHGTQSSDIDFATKTSETRRRLYKEGKYTPISHSMLWPRNNLIAWAEERSNTNS